MQFYKLVIYAASVLYINFGKIIARSLLDAELHITKQPVKFGQCCKYILYNSPLTSDILTTSIHVCDDTSMM